MAYGFLIESDIQAKDIDALNKFGVASNFDVDGGDLVQLTPSSTQGNDVYTATKPATGSLGGLYMAYNPSAKYLKVEGLELSGISSDIRHYTNKQGKTFTAFKVKKGDTITIPVSAITGGANAVATDYIEAVDGATKMTRVAHATGATSGSTAFEISYVGVQPFPQAGIGMEQVAVVKAVCVQE